jgi:branched-chain amino acid transport system substrate-binding protein
MQRNRILWAVILLVTLFGCAKREHESVDIGVALSLTGDGADYGKRSLNGIEWAVEKINAKGGINGRNIKLHIEDTKSSPKDAVAAIGKLITVDKVRIVVGDIISGTTLAMAPVAEKNSVLLLAPGASNPKMTSAGDFIFRDWTSDEFDGKAIARYAYEHGVNSAGLIVQKTEYTVGLADAFYDEFVREGGKVVGREEFDTGASNVRTQLSKLRALNAKAVYIAAYSEGTGLALKQAQEVGFRPKWFSSLTVDTPDCERIAGSLRDGVVFSTPAFDLQDTSHVMRDFVTGFQQRFNDVPETSSGHGYDAIMILASVIEKVGADPVKVKDGLYKVSDFPGVTGKTTFDSNGDVLKDIFIKTFVSNRAVILERFNPRQ